MAKRKPRRVHVDCETAEGFRWLKRFAASSGAATRNDDGSFTINNGAAWQGALGPAGCRVTQQLDGAKRRR